MQRNDCKRKVLQALEDLKEPAQPAIVTTWLDYQYNVSLTDRACSMELLRLQRQGLLHRKDGRYWLALKGEERLVWLRSTAQ